MQSSFVCWSLCPTSSSSSNAVLFWFFFSVFYLTIICSSTSYLIFFFSHPSFDLILSGFCFLFAIWANHIELSHLLSLFATTFCRHLFFYLLLVFFYSFRSSHNIKMRLLFNICNHACFLCGLFDVVGKSAIDTDEAKTSHHASSAYYLCAISYRAALQFFYFYPSWFAFRIQMFSNLPFFSVF